MKRKFTFLIAAALMLLTMMVQPITALGQTPTEVTFTFSDHYTSNTVLDDNAIAIDNVISATFHKRSGGTATQYYTNGTAVRWYGGGTLDFVATNATITEISITFTQTANSISANTGTYSNGTWSGSASSLTLTQSGTSGHCRISAITVTYSSSGGGPTEDNDLALTDAPVELTFDLYNNSSAQVINYTTSSTDTVSIADNQYINTEIDEENKTITVTPVKVTPSEQTITVNQAADDTYYAGSTTFSVNITDSTPFAGGDVTFDPTNPNDQSSTLSITKQHVTLECTSGVFNNGTDYRLYKSSTTTISTDYGTITSIAFTCASGNDATGFDDQTGWVVNNGNGTWTGNEASVSFVASIKQVRATEIVVTVAAPTTDPSITASDVNIAYDAQGGNIEFTIVNPDDDATLEAEVVEDATISNFTLGNVGESTIAFTCDANTETTARTATVTLNYVKNTEVLATKDVTITQAASPTIYTSFEALLAAAPTTATNVYISFQNWVITGANNSQHAFLSDGINGCIIYGSDLGFTAGDILSGTVQCKFQKYNGSLELTNLKSASEGLTVTTGGTVTIAEIAMADLQAVNTGALVHYENLLCDARTEGNYTNYYLIDANNNEIQVYKTLLEDYANYLEDGKTYNITGVFVLNNTTKRVNPRSADDIEEVIVVTPVISAENVEITYDATSGTITYEIENYVAGNMTASTEATWISDFTYQQFDEIGEVGFTTTENDGAARQATVTLTYTYNTNQTVTKNVTVSQAAAPVPSITVTPATVNAPNTGETSTLALTYQDITITGADDFDIQYYDANNEPLSPDPDWLLVVVEAGQTSGYVVSYTIDENDSDARTAYFKVFAMNGEEFVYSNLVTINQAAYVPPVQTENYELFSGDLVEGDYLIVYVGSAMKNTVNSNRLQYEDVIPENNVISTNDATIVWHIAPSATSGYWTIYSANVDAYAASTGANNKAQMLADGTDDKALWSVTGTETYDFVNKYNANASVNAYLRNNVTTQQNYGFACYANSTGGALSLYKKVDNTPSITLQQYTYNLNANGGQAELAVVYNNMPANPQAVVIFYESDGVTPLTENPTWITATINGNNNVNGNIQANTGEARSAYFKVKGIDADNNDVYSDLVTINQAAYVLSIVFETTELDIEVGGEQNRVLSFEYQGFGENPTFDVRQYDATGQTQTTYEWLTTTITQGHKVNITVAANTGSARSGYFKVYGTDGTVNTESNLVTINQAAAAITYTITFDVDGGTFVPNEHFATVSEQKEAGTYNLPSATKEGWEFAGWNDGTTTYEANAEYTVSANMGFTAMWTEITTGIIYFGATSNNSSTPINGASVTGDDSFGNTWTITTVGTTSYTNSNDSGYAQVGSSSKPATSITFTTTLAQETIITAFSAKFGGFSGTAGTVALKIDDTSVGSGSLNESSDVVVENTTTATGTVLTVTVTGISKGVKCYYISYTISTGTDPMIVAQNSIDLSSTDTYGEFDYSIVNPATGVNLTASSTDEWISDINVTAEKVTFVTTQNTSTTDDREGTITLSYTGATDKVVTVTQSKVDFATVPFTYDGNAVSDVPVGLTSNLSGNYGTSPKMKFDATGKYIILKLNEAPKSLSYDIKGQTYSSGTFSVQASVNGSDYENLAVYNSDILNNTIQTFTLVDLSTDVRYIKWIFTEKGTGNIALGNIRALEHYETYGDVTFNSLDLTTTQESLIVHSGSVVTVTGTLINSSPDQLVIKDGGQLILPTSSKATAEVSATVEKDIVAAPSWGVGNTAENWYTISSPMFSELTATDVTGLITTGEGNDYDLYRYDEANNYWRNYKQHTFAIEPSRGYLYASQSGTTIAYAGIINDDDVNCPVTKTADGFNLIGNPFTQNITMENIGGATLSGGYILQQAGNWKSDVDLTVAPCQGFLVQVSESTNLTISRTTSGSKSRANRDYIGFTVANGQYEDVTYALFEDAIGLDKINHRNADIPMLYIPQNDKNYAIATMDDNTQAFNLNFKAMTTGQYTLSFKAQGSYSYLHVIDRITGEDIDMLLDGEYTFIGSPRDNENRFIVKLNYNANIDELEAGDSFAYQYGNGIIVNGKGELQVFDVNGRMVMNTVINGKQTVNVPTTGLYIFRMVGESVKTQKIVVR